MKKLFKLIKDMIEDNVHDDKMLTACLEIIRDLANTEDCTRVGIGGRFSLHWTAFQ